MKLVLFCLLFSLTSLSLFSQKEKIEYNKETGVITLDGKEIFKVKEEKSATVLGMKDYTIQSLDGKNLLILVYKKKYEISSISRNNPDGVIPTYDIVFFNENKDKTNISFRHFKPLMRFIWETGMIKDNQLDKSAVEIFMMKNGY